MLVLNVDRNLQNLGIDVDIVYQARVSGLAQGRGDCLEFGREDALRFLRGRGSPN